MSIDSTVFVLPPVTSELRDALLAAYAPLVHHSDKFHLVFADTAEAGFNIVRLQLRVPKSVSDIVTPILKSRFQAKGFQGSNVFTEEDFDGEVVVRVKARLATPIEVMDRVDATLEIKDALEQKGESRTVYLDVATEDEENASESPDEEI